MNRKSVYNTWQRKAIIECMAHSAGTTVTMAEIYEKLRKSERPIGLTTVYRHIEKLARQGTVKKLTADDAGGARYEYIAPGGAGAGAFYIKCDGCGRLAALDCALLEELERHMQEDHGFRLDSNKSVFYGQCRDCGVSDDKSAETTLVD